MATKKEDKEVVLKDVSVSEANDAPEKTVPVADVLSSTTVQAAVAPEAKIDPIQPEAPSASDVAAELGVDITAVGSDEDDDEVEEGFHKISAADLEAHPELADQGFKVGKKIAFGSAKVYKYATADRTAIVPVAWPMNVTGTLV